MGFVRLAIVVVIALASCGDNIPSAPDAPETPDVAPAITTIAVASLPSLPVGVLAQAKATGTYADGTTTDLTAQVVWASSHPEILAIDATGKVHALAVGGATIVATFQDQAGSMVATVSDATLVTLAVTPASPMVPRGLTQQLVATGTFTDAQVMDLTDQVAWQSSDPSIASVANGLVVTHAIGAVTIGASLGSVPASATLEVLPAALVSLAITPSAPAVAKGLTQQLVARGTFTDAQVVDLTAQVAWQSSDPAIASVSNGLVATHAIGTATISASLGSVPASATLEVLPAALVSLAITPAPPTVAGLTRQLVAMGTFTDGQTLEMTALVQWQSSDPQIAQVSAAGQLVALAAGTVTVHVSLGSVSANAIVEVLPPELVSLAVEPSDPTIQVSFTRDLRALGTFTNGARQDLTAQVTWTSLDDEVAMFDLAVPGRVRALSVGTATVVATLGSVAASTVVTVPVPSIVSIEVTPADAFVDIGTMTQFTAVARFSDATVIDITDQVTWSSSSANVVVSNTGLAIATGPAIATITATDPVTSVAGSTQLIVTDGPVTIDIAFAGDALGEVEVLADGGSTSLAVCTSPCTVVLTPGTQIELRAATASRFDGFAGACTAALPFCNLTVGAVPLAVTATFNRDPGELWTRLIPGGPLLGADFDSAGNLIVGSATQVSKLAPDGSTVWTRSLPGQGVRIGPDDTIHLISGTELVKLDGAGDTIWTRPLGTLAAGPLETAHSSYVQRMDVGPSGEIAVDGFCEVATWSSDGSTGWSATVGCGRSGIAIDSTGVTWIMSEDPGNPETTVIAPFSTTGVPLAPDLTPVSQYHGMIAVDASDHLVTATSGHSDVYLDRRSPSDALDFFHAFSISDGDFLANGVAIAGTQLFWIHDLEDALPARLTGFVARRVDGTGTIASTLIRPSFGYGVRAHNVAGHASGRAALVGSFHGFASDAGWVQVFQ